MTLPAALRRHPIIAIGCLGVCGLVAAVAMLSAHYVWSQNQLLTAEEIEHCLGEGHETWDSLASCLCSHSYQGKRNEWEAQAETDESEIKRNIAGFREHATLNSRFDMRASDLQRVVKSYRVGNDRPGTFGGGGSTHDWLILVDSRGRIVGWIGLGGASPAYRATKANQGSQ